MHWQWSLAITAALPFTLPCALVCLSFQEILEMIPPWPESDHFALKGLHEIMLCGFFPYAGSLPRHPTERAAEDANPAAYL